MRRSRCQIVKAEQAMHLGEGIPVEGGLYHVAN